MVQLKTEVLEDRVVFPSNGVKQQVSNCKLFIGEQEYGCGSLCVAEWSVEHFWSFFFNLFQNYFCFLIQLF